MKRLYRSVTEQECERSGSQKGDEFLIKAFYEPIEGGNWCLMLGFFDELRAELVYLFEGTILSILDHKFSLREGKLFVLPGEEELSLRQKHFFKRDDLCLKGIKGGVHKLRDFQGKRVIVLRGKQA